MLLLCFQALVKGTRKEVLIDVLTLPNKKNHTPLSLMYDRSWTERIAEVKKLDKAEDGESLVFDAFIAAMKCKNFNTAKMIREAHKDVIVQHGSRCLRQKHGTRGIGRSGNVTPKHMPQSDALGISSLPDACQVGKLDILKTYISIAEYHENSKHQCKQLLRDIMKQTDTDGKSLLHIAYERGNKNMVKALLDIKKYFGSYAGIKFFTDCLCHQDNSDRSVLHESCQLDDDQITGMLLDAASDLKCVERLVTINDSYGQSALLEAFKSSSHMKVRLILNHVVMDGCVNRVLKSTNGNKQTLFHLICRHGCDSIHCMDEVIKVANKDVVHHGHTQNDRFKMGKTFLSYISEANEHMIKLLVKTITEIEVKELKQAEEQEGEQRPDHIRIILATKDKDRKTAMHHAQEANLSGRLVSFFTPIYELYRSDTSSTSGGERT